MGLNPIFMSFPELYEALDRGTIFGYMAPIQLAEAYKHYEIGKYVVPTGSGAVLGSAHIGMNRNTWKRLPKEYSGDSLAVDHRLCRPLGRSTEHR